MGLQVEGSVDGAFEESVRKRVGGGGVEGATPATAECLRRGLRRMQRVDHSGAVGEVRGRALCRNGRRVL